MSSIAEAQKVRELERKLEALEARVEVLERVTVLMTEDPIAANFIDGPRRKPGRPRKQPQVEA